MKRFNEIFKMDIKNLFTNPMWVFYSTGFGLLLVLILGFLTSGSYGATITSYDYYGITMLVFGALNAATLAANSFMENRIKSANMRIIYSPVKPSYIYFSKILATSVFSIICTSAVAIVLHFLVGINLGGVYIFYTWLLMCLVVFFAASLGVMCCCLLKSEEVTNQIVSNLITLFAVLGGLFFPMNGLGSMMEIISNLSPLKWIIMANFQVIYDANFSVFIPTCFLLIILSIVCIGLSGKFFRTEDYI